MIIGLFLRNYKCYGNLNFIPFVQSDSEKLNVFIGENGVGKSSVLEALDCLLNDTEPKKWETTNGMKKDKALICPVFLIEKAKFQTSDELEAISNMFWNSDFNSINANSNSADRFIEWRNQLKTLIDTGKYYLVAIGKDSSNNVLLTSSFHNTIANATRKDKVSKQKIIEIFHKVVAHYSYIYIPVENKIGDVLNLESREMQGLMDKSVVDEIRNLLNKNQSAKGEKKSSIIDLINSSLNDYISEINLTLSDGYSFKATGVHKKNIRPNDILQAIFKEYFQIRPLTKDGKHINSLSSGQQRLALIDVASTLLSRTANKSKEIILAIDEPESSLQSSYRFEQFSRLVSISEQNEHQIILTTHWYGLLLKPSEGRLNFVYDGGNAPRIKSFSLKNLFDDRKNFPDSIEMKSYFDLMSSMLSLLKKSDSNWLICEGYEDAKYLNLYLKEELSNVHILPFNGCGNVKKLYQFLSVPFSDKIEKKQISGKVFCLIDTDEKNLITITDYSPAKYAQKLKFERFLYERSGEVDIVSVSSPNATNTEIEDVLSAKIMWKAILNVSSDNEELKSLIKDYSFDEDVFYSDLTKEIGFLRKDNYEAYENFDSLKTLLHTDKIKEQIADEYCRVAHQEPKFCLPWTKNIIDFFQA